MIRALNEEQNDEGDAQNREENDEEGIDLQIEGYEEPEIKSLTTEASLGTEDEKKENSEEDDA